MAIKTRAQYRDYLSRVVSGEPISREDHLAAARFLICVLAARRNSHELAEGDASEGLEILRMLGENVPVFVGYGRYYADRVREWFTAQYGE